MAQHKTAATMTWSWESILYSCSPLQAGMNTAVGIGHCRCSHLTSFASGFIAAPNPIDWSAVLANASFLDSPTIYSTIICIMTIYILAAIWARRKDMKDVERVGILHICAHFCCESVHCGMWYLWDWDCFYQLTHWPLGDFYEILDKKFSIWF